MDYEALLASLMATHENNTAYDGTDYLMSLYSDLSLIDGKLAGMQQTSFNHHKPMTIVLMLLYAIVFLLGILGNIFVIAVVTHYRHMRTLTNVFLVNLTIGDLLVVCVCIPITLGNYIYTDWVYGHVLCKMTPFLQGSAIAVSNLSLLCISINRCVAIHMPLKAKFIFSKRKIWVLLVVVWLLSWASFSPLLAVNTVTSYGLSIVFKSRVCEEKWHWLSWKQAFTLFIFCILFVLPLVVMAFTYVWIGKTLWFADTKLHSSEATQTGNSVKQPLNRQLKQRRKTVKMLMSVVVIFGLCWLPYYVVNIWLDYNMLSEDATMVIDYIYPLVLLLGLSNSAMNPICYCFMSTGFQRALFKMCCRRRVRSGRKGRGLVRFHGKYHTSDETNVETMQETMMD
jgi:hypothetical protein